MSPATVHPLAVVEIPTCCGAAPPAAANGTKFHFSLNVSDLERSVAFYRVLFGVAPAKHYRDYAKFELAQPPLVFSLVPNPPSSGGTLSHFGFPVGTTEEVAAATVRLKQAGLDVSCQQGTVCGYARQDKVWVADPDRNYWEIYVVHEDVDPETVRSAFDGIAPHAADGSRHPTVSDSANSSAPVIWEHRILMPLPERIGHDDGTVDEVRLEGAFNDKFTAAQRRHLLSETARVLKPGGRLAVHGLVSDRPLDELPTLPGVGGLVQRVPTEREPLDELAAAGFVAVRVTKLPENPVFRHGAAEMREIKFEARKPSANSGSEQSRSVIYKGPFSSASTDDGQSYARGRRTVVSDATWNALAAGPAATQFVFLGDPAADDRSCG